MNNIVQAILDCTYPEANKKVWQYDYGQILRIQGQQLPKAVEIHFSLTQSSGDSITRIGTTKDGVTEVPIPDSLLENSGKSQNYDIYAYIYIEDGTSGNTEYRIRIPVRTRPKPEIHDTPEEAELFCEVINAVNDAADRADASEQNAKTSETEAGRYAEEAKESAQETAQTKENALEEIGGQKQGAISAIKKQEESSIGNVTEHADTEIRRIQNQTSEFKSELESTIEQAANKNTKLEESIQTAEEQKVELDKSIESARGQKLELFNSANEAERTKSGLDESIQNATDKKAALDTTIGQANTVDASLKKQIGSAEKIQENVEQIDKNKNDISSLKEDMATKLDSPIELPEVGKVLKVESVNEDGTFVCEWAGSCDLDVRIDGQSIVKDDVADIPIGSAGKPGVIGIPGGTYGLEKDDTNNIRLIGLNNNDINKRHYAKPLLGNTLDYAIKSAMSAPIADTAGMIEDVYHYPAWTADEQASARERLGVISEDDFELIATVNPSKEEIVSSISIDLGEPIKANFYIVCNIGIIDELLNYVNIPRLGLAINGYYTWMYQSLQKSSTEVRYMLMQIPICKKSGLVILSDPIPINNDFQSNTNLGGNGLGLAPYSDRNYSKGITKIRIGAKDNYSTGYFSKNTVFAIYGKRI